MVIAVFRLHYGEKEIVHRDIKPANILVGNTKGLKILKIGDFNISKVDITAFTMHTTSALGSATALPYKAPEIFAGEES